jgi:hypothetical protein
MKNIVIALFVVLALASHALAAGIADLPWTEPNIENLRTFDKTAVVRFVNQVSGNEGTILATKEGDIGDFTWADLAGDGKYQLLVVYDVNGRGFFNDLAIYTQESPGKIRRDDIEGWGIGWDLSKVIRDLDADNKKELIISTMLTSLTTVSTVTWPAVYRLKDGKYVEASREFSSYYDDEVLPGIELELTKVDAIQHPSPGDDYRIAVALLLKSKILRMLRRNPTAGLQEAYEWMNSDNPELLHFAGATFREIGGHETEVREAGEKMRRAMCKEHPGMVMCDKAAVERQVREACRQDPHMTVCRTLQ